MRPAAPTAPMNQAVLVTNSSATPPGVALGIHLDIGVAAGGEQALDGLADIRHAQGAVDFKRQQVVQFGRVERLLGRIEADGGDGEPLVWRGSLRRGYGEPKQRA